MLAAKNLGGYVLASQVTKEYGPFVCPMCEGGVVVKKGRINIHHFAHIPPSTCVYGQGETGAHRNAKQEIYDALLAHEDVTKLQLERPLGDVRPDISFYLRNVPIAIEVQISTLSMDIIDKRTKAYARMVWLAMRQKGVSLSN